MNLLFNRRISKLNKWYSFWPF